MRKILSLLLVAALLCLLSGCEEEETPTEATVRPAATTAVTEEATEAATEETETATEPPETLAEEMEESPLRTGVIRSGDEQLQAEYILLALNSEGPFLSEDITFNEKGAEYLIHWLLGDGPREKLGNFGVDTYGEAVFSLPEQPAPHPVWIPDATEETKTIRLVVSDTLEKSGILEELLTEFEETYGYQVNVQSTTDSGAIIMAKLGIFDVVLAETSSATDSFVAEGYARLLKNFETEAIPFCGMEYLLCGPKEDPAGAGGAEDLTQAMAAIAESRTRFLSCGDDSTVHKLEQSLWPEGQTFGDWYLSVGTQTGPLLVMNEFEGGYVLTDKLTWLQFYQANGII